MAIRKIISRSIGVDVIAAEDLAAGSVQTAEIQNGVVTGPKLADNLNYDSGTLYLDSTNNRVGVGTASPTQLLHIGSTSIASGSAAWQQIQTNGNNMYVGIGTNDAAYIQANGEFRIATGGYADRVTVDSSGNVGIATSSPAATSSTYKNLQLALGGIVSGRTDDTPLYLSSNVSYNAGWKYIANTTASQIALGTNIQFFNAPSGTAGAGATLTERMRIDSNGNVGIGVAPSRQLHIYNASESNIRLQGGADYAELRVKDADNALSFHYGGTERMRIGSNGNVGIGTPSPGTMLGVAGTVTADGLTVNGGSRFNDYIHFGGSISTPQTAAAIYRPVDNQLAFSTANTERMRISNNGHLLVGIQSNVTNGSEGVEIRGDAGYIKTGRNSTGTTGHILFYNPNGNVGSITTTGSNTAYNTSSDYRLKENVEYDFDATTRLKQLKPARFNFIADADKTVDGFLAHEVQDIVPEAITGIKDGMRDEEYEVTPAVEATYDDDGNILTEEVPAVMGTRSVPDYQGIDQGKLVPLLVKSLQEALTEIDSLKARLNDAGL